MPKPPPPDQPRRQPNEALVRFFVAVRKLAAELDRREAAREAKD